MKRSSIGYIGLGLGLACWMVGAILLVLSDRSTPYLIASGTLCVVAVVVQTVTYRLQAQRLLERFRKS
ncbi:tetrahydromethanopterin S-methyltransferase subunit C [Paraburkholderia sp. GAS32]